jgi:AAA family ATP:ADP antiporter
VTHTFEPKNRADLIRMAALCAISFVSMVGYAMARTPIESVFIEDWGRDAMPWAWLGIAAGAVAVVSLWDRAAARFTLPRMMFLLSATSGVGFALLLLGMEAGLPQASFLAYIFKDLYIVLLVEAFYAFANSTYPLETARWAYGLFGIMASLGGRVGNKAIEPLATSMGTERVPWLVLPSLILICFFVGWLAHGQDRANIKGSPAKSKEKPGLILALKTVRNSRYLLWLVALIASVQLATNLIEYVYQGYLETHFVLSAERAGVSGDVYAAIDDFTLAFNLAAGLVLRRLGVSLTLLVIPVLVGCSAGFTLVIPGFLAMAACKVANKSFDYSLFRVAKEALYLPLSYEEKVKGKAVVDVLTYRVAKGGASLLSFALIALGAQHLAMELALALMVLWIACTVVALRRYKGLLEDQCGIS